MSQHLRDIVFIKLDSAVENGNEDFVTGSAEEIAWDLTCYAEYCEEYEPEALLPHVEAWKKSRGRT